jgi:hypothetical protein
VYSKNIYDEKQEQMEELIFPGEGVAHHFKSLK